MGGQQGVRKGQQQSRRRQDVDELLDTYMTMILVGTSNKQDLLEDKAKLFSGYQFWNETQTFARQAMGFSASVRQPEKKNIERSGTVVNLQPMALNFHGLLKSCILHI